MEAPCADGPEFQTSGHGDWAVAAVRLAAIAELAEVVEAPAPSGALRSKTAAIAAGDRGDEAHVALLAQHAHRHTVIGMRAVAKLAIFVPSPAIGGTVSRQRAGMRVARADGVESQVGDA
jgi:hypothetical protein